MQNISFGNHLERMERKKALQSLNKDQKLCPTCGAKTEKTNDICKQCEKIIPVAWMVK